MISIGAQITFLHFCQYSEIAYKYLPTSLLCVLLSKRNLVPVSSTEYILEARLVAPKIGPRQMAPSKPEKKGKK